jgi:hypothetical protein
MVSEFKSGKYGGQSARVQNSLRTCGWSWQFGTVINPLEDVFSIRIHPMDPGDLILFQKIFVDISIDTFAGRNLQSAALKGLSHEIEMSYKRYKATEPY